jgi:outer membrane protein TolC
MKHFFIIVFSILSCQVFAQDTLLLDSCIQTGLKNHPISKDKTYLNGISTLTIKDNLAGYYPSLDFEGKATYQSDVFRIDLDLPDIPGFDISFPEPPLDQYNFSVNLSQLIFDGGMIKNLNQTERLKLESEIKKTDVDLYTIREQIEKSYFALLMFQQTEFQLELTIKELKQKRNTIQSAVNNGLLSSDNLDILSAEILKLEQGLIEITENKRAGIKILSELMSAELNDNILVKLPDDVVILRDSLTIQRPENELFSLQKELLTSNKNLLHSGRMPKFGAFAQAGYGNPGLTMVNDEWNPYFIVGAKLSWKIWDKNITKHNIQMLKIRSDMVDTKEESFDKNIRIQFEKEYAEIDKLVKIIEKDEEIIKLRESICTKADSKYDNGIITATDYLTLINEKNRSKIMHEIHKIQLIQAKRNVLRITGNNN